jgi:P-type Cu+ transporter
MEATNTTIQASQIICQGCANTAKAAVRKVSGVEEASVDLAAQRVTVTHQPNVEREALVDALTKAGFPAA